MKTQRLNEHTRGPWICVHDTDHSRISPQWGQFRLAVVESCAKAEREANARLIAAAPELWEALQELLSCVVPTGMDTRTDRAMAKAQSALDKALNL